MSDEIIWTYASRVVLESNGSASIAVDAYGVANDADLAVGNHLNYPWADFVLTCGFGGDVGAGKFVRLYRQSLNIDGANDAPVPAAGHERLYMGSFVIPQLAAASSFWYPLTDLPLIKDQQYSIENKTDQTISANWELKATPKTYGTPVYDWIGIDSSHLDSHCGDEPGYTLADALDGSGYWVHEVNEVHEFVLDLGANFFIEKIKGVSSTVSDPNDVDIFVSVDGIAWGVAVATALTFSPSGWQEYATNPKIGQYVKVVINGTEHGSNYIGWRSFGDPANIFDVYGTAL